MAGPSARVDQVAVERIVKLNRAKVSQVAIENVTLLQPRNVYITQVACESIKSFQTTPIRATQVAVEAIVSRVTSAAQVASSPYYKGPVPGTGTPHSKTKYRILVWDTSENLVAVFNNCRAFDFIDAVNGGSAAGWFRISTDTTTLLSADTAGTKFSDQYKKQYIQGYNAINIALQFGGLGPPLGSYRVTFSGNCGQQLFYINVDDKYRIPINIPAFQTGGAAQTPATVAALTAAAVQAYLTNLSNQYSVTYTAGHTYFDLAGASSNTEAGNIAGPVSAQTFTQGGVQYYFTGVTATTTFVFPKPQDAGNPTGGGGVAMGGLSSAAFAAYQQAFQYNYRVQFFLEDSVNPWYDGRINGWTPMVPDTSTDDSYITIYTEGWQNALDDGIVTETLNPGLQPNGVNNGQMPADKYLSHLLRTYQDSSKFGKPFISSVNVDLFQMQFQGEGLGSCVNDVITQVVSSTGHTFEWWVRGLWTVGMGKSLAVVIQPNCDPNDSSNNPYMRIAPTSKPIQRYFVYEVRGQTIYNYQVQNTDINVHNMIALYGGRDPDTQQQVYGAYEDSISIALYGLRQQRVTNDNLLTQNTLNNYAIAYLLLNGYPQPQTQYYKYKPTDAMRAGVWVSVLEMGSGTVIGQNLHQMRAIQVECQLQEDQEKMDQVVTAAAPLPFIDHAYYGAIQQSKNAIPTVISRGGTINPKTYMVGGGDWVDSPKSGSVAWLSVPLGHFGTATVAPDGSKVPNSGWKLPLKLSMTMANKQVGGVPPSGQQDGDFSTQYPNVVVPLTDSNTGKHGDGAYELDFCTDLNEFVPSAPHGQGVLVTQIGGIGSTGTGGITSSGVQQVPSSPNMLRLWQFVVLDGAIAGAVDMRTYYGQYSGAPKQAGSILFTLPKGIYHAPWGNVHYTYSGPYQTVGNTPQKLYGNVQFGIKGAEMILWFAQAGAPNLNGQNTSYTPSIYNGDMSWFSGIGGTVTMIPQPDWAAKLGWTEDTANTDTMGEVHPISIQPNGLAPNPIFKPSLPATLAGPKGVGFLNYNFPGGQGALMTMFFPNLQFPLTPLLYLFYRIDITVVTTSGDTLSCYREFVIRNLGNGHVGG